MDELHRFRCDRDVAHNCFGIIFFITCLLVYAFFQDTKAATLECKMQLLQTPAASMTCADVRMAYPAQSPEFLNLHHAVPARSPCASGCQCGGISLYEQCNIDDLLNEIDQYILARIAEFKSEVPVVVHGSFGLYARAAAACGQHSADVWRRTVDLPRHGDIDVLAVTKEEAVSLGEYLVKKLNQANFSHISSTALKANSLYISQSGQFVDGQPVSGYMIWYAPWDCTRPKTHYCCKVDVCVGARSGSEVIFNYGKQKNIVRVADWSALFDELSKDNRHGGFRAIKRLEALEKTEKNEERLEKIRSLLDKKQQQLQNTPQEVIPNSFTEVREWVTDTSTPSPHNQLMTLIPALFYQMQQPHYHSDDALKLQVWIHVAYTLRSEVDKGNYEKDTLDLFWKDINRHYPDFSLRNSWAAGLYDVLFNQADRRFNQRVKYSCVFTSPRLYLTKHLCKIMNQSAVTKDDIVNRTCIEVNERIADLKPFCLSSEYPLDLQYLLAGLPNLKKEEQYYACMLLFVEKLISKSQAENRMILIMPSSDTESSILVKPNGHAELNFFEMPDPPVLSDVFVISKSFVVRHGVFRAKERNPCPYKDALFNVVSPATSPFMEKVSRFPEKSECVASSIPVFDNGCSTPVTSTDSGISCCSDPVGDESGSYKSVHLPSDLSDTNSDTEEPLEQSVDVPTSSLTVTPDVPVVNKSASMSLGIADRKQALLDIEQCYNKWVDKKHPRLSDGLYMYRRLTKSLSTNPHAKGSKTVLGSCYGQLNMTSDRVSRLHQRATKFLQNTIEYLQGNPDVELEALWTKNGQFSHFLPLLHVRSTVNDKEVLPFCSLKFCLPCIESSCIRNAFYLFWIARHENFRIHVLGRSEGGKSVHLAIWYKNTRISVIEGEGWMPAPGEGITILVGSNGYALVDYDESEEKSLSP